MRNMWSRTCKFIEMSQVDFIIERVLLERNIGGIWSFGVYRRKKYQTQNAIMKCLSTEN